MFVYGSGHYGQTDYVSGAGIYVVTEFYFMQNIPFWPVKSYLILDHQGDSFTGIPLGLSTKSVALTWLRASVWLFGLLAIAGGWGLRESAGASLALYIAGGLMLAGWAATYYLPVLGYATYETACELAAKAKLTDAQLDLIDEAYGQRRAARAIETGAQG